MNKKVPIVMISLVLLASILYPVVLGESTTADTSTSSSTEKIVYKKPCFVYIHGSYGGPGLAGGWVFPPPLFPIIPTPIAFGEIQSVPPPFHIHADFIVHGFNGKKYSLHLTPYGEDAEGCIRFKVVGLLLYLTPYILGEVTIIGVALYASAEKILE